MFTIGLAGGIASGKSFVAQLFADLGAQILNADQLGHQVLTEPKIIEVVIEALGQQVVDENGQLVRAEIAKLVFGEHSEAAIHLNSLEQITHPRISELIQQRLEQLELESHPAVILDAPVMFKSGWDRFCDKIVFIESDAEIRLQRALARGWTEKQFLDRENSQTALDVKRSRATNVIDNNHDSTETNQQVVGLWKQWSLPMPENYEVPVRA